MRLPKDIISKTYVKPKFFLCETDKTKICELKTYNTHGTFKFNSMSELTFDVPRVYNDVITGETHVNPFYDKIEALRLIEIEDIGYFELQGPQMTSDGIEERKSCTAYSLEYTLSQKYLEDFYINRGTADSLEVINSLNPSKIVPIRLYNPSNKKLSLLHLVLEKIYGWTIGHVDTSLWTLSRQFEVDRESVYDFLINEVCEKFNCYIVFDTIESKINVYAESLTAKFIGNGATQIYTISPPFDSINTVSIDGYKTTEWTYDQSTGKLTLTNIPEKGARIEVVDGSLAAWETDVFVTFDNLSQEVNIDYDADSIKTVLTVTYGDDYDIREINLGLPYLTDLSYYYTVDWMGQDLYDAYTEYLSKSNEAQDDYTQNSKQISIINDKIYYEENRLSLEYSEVKSVSEETVGIYYVRHEDASGNYYYSEVSLPSEYNANETYYSNETTNVNENLVQNLYTALQDYYYGYFRNDNDKQNEAVEELKKLQDDFSFVGSYFSTLCNNISKVSLSNKDTLVKNFLEYLWPQLGRTPLKMLYLEPYKIKQGTNAEAGWSLKGNENYGLYYPVLLFISTLESAIKSRDIIIRSHENKRSQYELSNQNISDGLLMQSNFTKAQLIRLNSFLREDELHLDDIVQTSQDNLSSSFKVKQDAMESGRIELQKLCQPQLQFSMSMANIYALPEFEPIIAQFQLGKVIKVGIRPDYIKQSRLLQVNINFDNFSDFSCEFGELTNLRTQSDIHADLLSQALSAGKSVATNSSYWTKGSDQATATDLKIQQGLLDAVTQIKSIDGTQSAYIDKYGIHLKKADPSFASGYDDKQGWIVNNQFLYSDDAFQTVKSVFGEYTVPVTNYTTGVTENHTYWGLLAEAVIAGYIEGSMIKGGDIYSINYKLGESGTHINLTDGDFDFAGGKIVYNADTDELTLQGVTINWETANIPDIDLTDIPGFNEYLEKLGDIETQLDQRAQTWYQGEDPSVGWTTTTDKEAHVGDLWFNTTNNVSYIYGSDYKWAASESEVPQELYDKIDGKASVYTSYQNISSQNAGDLLIPSSDFDHGDYHFSQGKVYRCCEDADSFDASKWTEIEYTDDTRADEAYQKATSATATATQARALANSSQSIAQNAQQIGEQLVSGLGFDGTKITGTHIVTPVIAGGSLLIGDKNGTYAQITTDGKLTCTNAEIIGGSLLIGTKSSNSSAYAEITSNGVLTCKSGNFTNALFTVDKDLVKTKSDFTMDDAERVLKISTGLIEASLEDYAKYDLSGEGIITANDANIIMNLVSGQLDKHTTEAMVEINPASSDALIRTNGVFIGTNSIKAKSANIKRLNAENIFTTGQVSFRGNVVTNSNVLVGAANTVRISRGVDVGTYEKNAITLTLLEDTQPRLDIYASDSHDTVMIRSVTKSSGNNYYGYMSLSPEYLIVGNWEALTGITKPTEAQINQHYAKVKAEDFENASLESIKTNIVETDSVLDLFKPENSKIYSYNLKKTVKTKAEAEVETVDNGDDRGISLDGNGVVIEEEIEEKTSYGFVIGDDYTVPAQVLNKGRDAISLYSMASLNWKATQELYIMLLSAQEKIKELENKLIGEQQND